MRANAPHPTIALLQSNSLTSVVQAELERMILSGELAPGEKLTEMTLAAQLGVSRGPLREAFRMLEEAGLVRTEKNRGVFVRDIPIEEAIEIFDLRAATFPGETATASATLPRFGHYAVTARFAELENTALVPGENSVAGPAEVPSAPAMALAALALSLLATGRRARR